MSAGRPSKSAKEKRLQGVRSERINNREPIPDLGDVVPPADLSDEARTVWDSLAPDLVRKDVLTPWDVDAFVVLCNAIVLGRRAQRMIDKDGPIVEAPVFNRNGEITGERVQRSEWLMVLKDANTDFARFGARFGLTPADRAGLKVGDGKQQDPAIRLLSS